MRAYVLGVDGGSTKTHCTLFDTQGNRIDFIQVGSTNHETLKGSFDEFREKLGGAILEMIGRHHIGISSISQSVFGLSGADTKSQHWRLSSEISKIGLSNFIVCNDSYLGIKAGSKNGYGVGVVNGSGCTISGINQSGRIFTIGGQAEFTGEPGGGGFLGYYAIRSSYNQLFRGGKKTLMKEMLFDMFKPSTKYDFLETIREKIDSGELKVGDLSRVVFEAANQSDELALEILKYMGNEVGMSVNGIIRELEFSPDKELDIVLVGSINVKGENPTYLETLERKIISENKDRKINFTVLNKPPVAGAVVWALNRVNGSADLYDKVLSQF